jgi:FkbM family methyltransferase
MRFPSLVRRLTLPITGRMPLPILSGPNVGRLWCVASAGHGYVSGRRGIEQLRLMSHLVQPGDCVWDVGAHHGYVSLYAAKLVGRAGSVVAFEPSLANRTQLARHMRWNRASDVQVSSVALSDRAGTARFGGAGTTKTFALGAGDELVQMQRADALIASGTLPQPAFAKIDVEGAEADVLRALLGALEPTARVQVAVHSLEAYHGCRTLAEQHGWRLVPSIKLRAGLESGRWHGDPDLLLLGAACPTLSASTRAIGGLAADDRLPA